MFKQSREGEPLVSVVTVVKNDAAHIEKTILSVLNQTYKNIEYIVVDGGSTDGTLEIIKKYADRIDKWISEPDKGIYYGWNKGVDLATGDWIEFLNCDDYFYNERVVEDIFAGKKIEADGVYGSVVGYVNGRLAHIEAHDDVVEKAWMGMRLIFESLFMRTEIVKKFKFDTSYIVSADGDFVLKCVANGYKFQKVNVTVFETPAQGFSGKHWLIARKENWQISRKYFPGLKTDWFNLYGWVYFVVFRFLKNILSAIGVYGFLRKYYRRWIGDKRMIRNNFIPIEEKKS